MQVHKSHNTVIKTSKDGFLGRLAEHSHQHAILEIALLPISREICRGDIVLKELYSASEEVRIHCYVTSPQ